MSLDAFRMNRRSFLAYAVAVGHGVRAFGRCAMASAASLVSGEVPAQSAKPKPPPEPPLRRGSSTNYAGMPDNSWLQITDGGPPAGIAAYSGFCIDDARDQLLIFGGGHHDYSGNEVWSVNLTSGMHRALYRS